MSVRDGINEWIKVEGWQIRVLSLNEHNIWGVIPTHKQTQVIIIRIMILTEVKLAMKQAQ